MITDGEYDYWTEGPNDARFEAPLVPAPTIEMIEGVNPLSPQLGVAEPLTVPEGLQEILFGQPAPMEAETAALGGDPATVPPLRTYAILDAAKVPDLPEMLDTSGLPHRCLFKGAAYDALKDAAPWIVQLEEGTSFTRNLFTRSDVPWHLWDKEPGIYIRSRSRLDDLWTHFRKFTKVKDETGKWFYQRFYEPAALPEFASAASSPFRASEKAHFATVIGLTHGTAIVATIKNLSEVSPAPYLNSHDRSAHDAAVERRFARDFAVRLMASLGPHAARLDLRDPHPISAAVDGITQDLKLVSFRRRSDIGRIAAMAVFYGRYFLYDPRIRPVAQEILTESRRAASVRALRFERAVAARPFHRLVTRGDGVRAVVEALTEGPGLQSRHGTFVWGLDDPDIAKAFDQCCLVQQDRHHLPPAGTSDHRWAHTALARLWTPFFLDDPLHRELRAYFADKQQPILPRLSVALNARLKKAAEDA